MENYLKKLSGFLGEKEFMAGGLTWIDFSIADLMYTLSIFNGEMMKKYPKLMEHANRVRSLPLVKEYV